MSVLRLQDRGKTFIHGRKGSTVLDEDTRFVDYLIKKMSLHSCGGETPHITFVPDKPPQPIGTVANEETHPSE